MPEINQKIIDCSIIILNYNGRDTLAALLDSVASQTVLATELILLDNHSNDGSDFIAQQWCQGRDRARYHQFAGNVGYARAMNWGIEHSSGSLICLLNVDILLETNYLERCAQVLERNDNVGMVSGILYRLVKGEKTLIVDSLGVGLNRNRYHDDIGAGVRVETPIQQTTSPFGVGGCAPVYSRKMILDVSLDENPFLELFESYCEDVDLAWRARKRGWKAVCTCETRAWHVREGSLSNKRLRAIARNRNHRNRIWLMILNERPQILFRHVLYWLPLQMFFLLKAFVQPGLFLAYADTVRMLPQIITVRFKRNKRLPTLSIDEEAHLFTAGSKAYGRRIKRYFEQLFDTMQR